MDDHFDTIKSKDNHIYPKEFWESVAVTDPYNAILDGCDEEKFWNTKPKDLLGDLNKRAVLLDLGCGIGRVARWVAPLVKEYHGIDFSSEMIKKAKEIFKDNKNVYFCANNGIDLKLFEDNKFDIVYVCLVFQHMQREITLNYIKETYRVLKKGGIFFANNIPKIESYIGGLTKDEMESAMKPFKILNLVENKFYYFIKCRK